MFHRVACSGAEHGKPEHNKDGKCVVFNLSFIFHVALLFVPIVMNVYTVQGKPSHELLIRDDFLRFSGFIV